MSDHYLFYLASIIGLGIGAQWLAWRFKLPSILLMLILGFLAGPVTGFLDPDALLGEMLFPFISLSLAIILFEGGLSLRVSDLLKTRLVVRNLLTIGVLSTWTMTAILAYFVLGMDLPLAILLGSIMVVTGPTVIIPLLMQIRPIGRVGPIAKWEGIMNDPLGAMLSLLVFEALLSVGLREAALSTAGGILKTVIVGGSIGLLAAIFMVIALRRFWIPDHLQETVSLMVVVTAFAASEVLQEESGLFAATIMGIALANQKMVDVRNIIEFKENLRTLLISSLFIILAARMPLGYIYFANLSSLMFVLALILIVRPVAVMLSTANSGLSWQEKAFLSWMAPRGIVAAAVSSIFALRLSESGYLMSEALEPVTFLVIATTVAVYGLSAPLVARRLGLAQPEPQGVLIVGAHPWAREIASILKSEGFCVLLVDTSSHDIYEAYKTGLPTYYGSILAEDVMEEIDLVGLGRLIALTPDDRVNSLAALHFADVFSRSEVYQLNPERTGYRGREAIYPQSLRGRLLFSPEAYYSHLTAQFAAGACIETTEFTENFKGNGSNSHFGQDSLPLFLITDTKKLLVYTNDCKPAPRPGYKLISMVLAR
ncbi:MAG: sodium:proton antiporter [Methanotrichaceae archaeon]|nr:sodium:proton antiporter [Methanotrichaceae archaeon]